MDKDKIKKRKIYNFKIIMLLIKQLFKEPHLRFNQLIFILNKTDDYFSEEPQETYNRFKKILK